MSFARLTLLVLLLGAMPSGPALAILFDAAADFSPSSNPNGVWQYGSKTTLGGAFTASNSPSVYMNLNMWNLPSGGSVSYNGTSSTIGTDGWDLLPGELGMHPGQDVGATEYLSVVRFTAPTSGLYDLDAVFVGRDHTTTTDVSVVLNGSPLFSAYLSSYRGAGQSYSSSLALAAGDLVDFVVDAHGGYFDDSTGLEATLELVPEPGTLLLLGAGTTGLAVIGRRRT